MFYLFRVSSGSFLSMTPVSGSTVVIMHLSCSNQGLGDMKNQWVCHSPKVKSPENLTWGKPKSSSFLHCQLGDHPKYPRRKGRVNFWIENSLVLKAVYSLAGGTNDETKPTEESNVSRCQEVAPKRTPEEAACWWVQAPSLIPSLRNRFCQHCKNRPSLREFATSIVN